ncbi:MAG: hypothetical protein HZB12_02970 [Candidatus Yonathbacteria bacterium]|nr:hypothetical protein [Candidatus Yonathbacteria bacterium]
MEFLDLGIGHAGDEGFGEEDIGNKGNIGDSENGGDASSSHSGELCAGEGADETGALLESCRGEGFFCVFVLELDDSSCGGRAEVG